MSKPVFADLFLLSGRRNRKSFFLLVMACMVGYCATLLLLYLLAGNFGASTFSLLLLVSAYVFFQVIVWIAAAQRFRDFGWPGWAALLMATAGIANLILAKYATDSLLVLAFSLLLLLLFVGLFVVPGQRQANRYGLDPLAGSGNLEGL